MPSPLVADLRSQKAQLRPFLLKAGLFALLFFLGDRALALALRHGLERYFGLDVPAQVVCVGHSHVVLGIDKLLLEERLGVPVAKYAQEGSKVADRYYMLLQYLERHPGSVKTVVYGVDANLFTPEGLSKNSYTLFYPFLDDPTIREHVLAEGPPADEYWLRRMVHLSRFGDSTLAFCVRGWMGSWSNLKHGTIDAKAFSEKVARGDFWKIQIDPTSIEWFEKTVRLVRERGIRVVLLYVPTIDILNKAEPELQARARAIFREAAAKDPGVVYLDYCPEFSSRHELFFDPLHLNPAGQREVTARLARDLRESN